MDDETLRYHLRTIGEAQRLTARSIADLALGLSAAETQSRARDAELQGMVLGLASEIREIREPRRQRRDSGITDRFRIPGADEADHVELTRRTQRRFTMWILLVIAAALLHVVQFVWQARLPDRPSRATSVLSTPD